MNSKTKTFAGTVLSVMFAFGILAVVPSVSSAQSAQTQANANARWNAFWTQFRSAVANKDRKKFIGLASKNFSSAGGETIEQWIDGGEPWSWADITRSIRRGTKPDRPSQGKFYRITRNSSSETIGDLIFVFENGRWKFFGPQST